MWSCLTLGEFDREVGHLTQAIAKICYNGAVDLASFRKFSGSAGYKQIFGAVLTINSQ